jgi:hypothetical protein
MAPPSRRLLIVQPQNAIDQGIGGVVIELAGIKTIAVPKSGSVNVRAVTIHGVSGDGVSVSHESDLVIPPWGVA